jgi:CRP-like cAMP-binding protein
MELLRGGKAVANVRAGAHEPVEVLTIPRADFQRVIGESPLTADAIGKIVQQRVEVHRAADSRTINRKPNAIIPKP